MRFYVNIFCLILISLLDCTPPTVSISNPTLPAELIKGGEFNPVPSIINVPVEIRTPALEMMIKEQLPPLLFESDTMTLGSIQNVKVKVWKGDSVRISLRERILESQLMVQKMLCNSRLAKNVYVNGFIDSLSIGDVRVTDRAIQAVVLAKGNLTLDVRE